MHHISVPRHIIERASGVRGGRHHFLDRVDLSRTAHVVVDMQNGFLEPGAPLEVPVARAIVPNVNRITRLIRAGGGLNVFLRFVYDPDEKATWSAMYAMFQDAARREVMKNAFSSHAHQSKLWPGLDIASEDSVVDKTRFSGMIPEACALHDLLTSKGIDTIIVTGTLTNCCCESTARDAMQKNFNVIFVSDANAALTDEEHNATLTSMTAFFADVMTTDEVVGKLTAAELMA